MTLLVDVAFCASSSDVKTVVDEDAEDKGLLVSESDGESELV